MLIHATRLMAPTNVYNLRAGSRSTSKSGSPVKGSGRRSTSTAGSPAKKQRKLGTSFAQRIATIPDAIAKTLEEAGVDSVETMAAMDFEELLGKVLCSEAPLAGQEGDPAAVVLLKREILTAWLRCLHSLAQHPEGGEGGKGANDLTWRDWLESRLAARMQRSASLSRSLEAMRLPLTRGDLVKQRQSLKRCGGPRPSSHVTWSMLKDAKGRLTKLPVGEALKDKVQPGQLLETRNKLKRCTGGVNTA